MYRRNDAEGLEDLLKTVGKDERGRDGKRMGGGWSPSRGGLKTEFVERKSPAGRLMDDTKIILATTLTLPVSRPGTPMQEDEARAARSPASVRAVSGTAVGSVPEDDKESGFVITMPIFKEHTDIWNEIRMMGGVAQGTKGRAERENYPDFEEGDRALEDSRYMRDGKVVVDEEHLAGIQQLLEDEDMEGAMEERRDSAHTEGSPTKYTASMSQLQDAVTSLETLDALARDTLRELKREPRGPRKRRG